MKHAHLLIALIVMVFLVTACAAPTRGNVDQPQAAATTVTDIPVVSPTIAPTEAPGKPFLSAPGVSNIKLLTDTQGAGAKPLFAWEATGGADRYQLVVFDQAGDPYWAWEGTTTQIYMGGTEAQPPADSSGPSIAAGYIWVVIAYDPDGKLLAASNVRPVSP